MSKALITIPLSKLKRAKLNARKTQINADIKGLAASIEAHGLLQNLTVRSVAGSDKGNSSLYEVVAGGRRLAALKLLAKRKKIEDDFEVPCALMSEEDAEAIEVSLAENVMRVPLHPADQFEAFSRLDKDGHGPEEIAARFGVTPTVVHKRLKLAAVSPRLMKAYRNEDMTLDQLMAFTISDDHEAQERVWFGDAFGEKTPYGIRRSLTRALVEGTDRRARFIGTKAYEVAGGTIVRDLFDDESEGYFEDSQLLDRLTAEKLSAEAEKIEAEGWSWIEARIENDFDSLSRFGRIASTKTPLSKKEQKKLDGLCERYDELVASIEDEADESGVAELDRITEEIDRITPATLHWSEEDMGRAGVIVSLDYQGNVTITRGLVRPEDGARPAPSDPEEVEGDGERPKKNGAYSEALLEELSSQRTVALQETLAAKPEVALTALLNALVIRTFFGEHLETCVGIRLTPVNLGSHAEGIGESSAAMAMADRHNKWAEDLPPKDGLWDWLSKLGRKRQLELLAYCIARTVNAVRSRRYGDSADRFEQAETLATTLSLDMSKWWQVTRQSYLDRVTKQHIVDAVSEAISVQAGENIATMKKAAMAAKAEELLTGSRWLPEPLRTRLSAQG